MARKRGINLDSLPASVRDKLREQYPDLKQKKSSKMGNVKVEYDGMTFDSIRERDRWTILQMLEKAGEISQLCRQVSFPLVFQTKKVRGMRYVADFVYVENGVMVVEDSKGHRTKAYKNKALRFEQMYGFKIKET